jgi:hypothetical protein
MIASVELWLTISGTLTVCETIIDNTLESLRRYKVVGFHISSIAILAKPTNIVFHLGYTKDTFIALKLVSYAICLVTENTDK